MISPTLCLTLAHLYFAYLSHPCALLFRVSPERGGFSAQQLSVKTEKKEKEEEDGEEEEEGNYIHAARPL